MKKAVITGGMGFVGRALADKLRGQGCGVRVLSRSARLVQGVEAVRVDYNDISSLSAALAGADTLFHLAAAIFAFNKKEFERANVDLTANLSCAAAAAGVKNFIYLSSQAAAGPSADKNKPRTEDDIPAPVSDYGATKLAAEEVVKARQKYPWITLKFCLPYPSFGQTRNAGLSGDIDETEAVCSDYEPGCLHKRNRQMTDESGHLICFCRETQGGTFFTLKEAEKQELEVVNLFNEK